MEYEPKEPYVFEIDNNADNKHYWFTELPKVINWAKQQNKEAKRITDNDRLANLRRINSIAVFFRTNSEVYRGTLKLRINFRKVYVSVYKRESLRVMA